MNYLSVENLSKSFGNKVLFENISFGISRGQKMALVAKNGAGKPPRVKIIGGIELADSGQVTLRKEITKAYLEQEPRLNDELTVLEAVLESENPITKAIKNYEKAIHAVEHGNSPADSENLHDAMGQMDILNAWDYELRIKQILSRLKITDL